MKTPIFLFASLVAIVTIMMLWAKRQDAETNTPVRPTPTSPGPTFKTPASHRFVESAVSLKASRTASGDEAYILVNDSDVRLADIRVTINRRDFVEDYAIGPKDEFYIPLKQALIFTGFQPVTHVGLHASVNGERKHWHWDIQ
jgi:hypothetical protein